MHSHTGLSWLRRHRRVVAIIVAVALALAVIATLVTTGPEVAEDLSHAPASEPSVEVDVAGPSWTHYFTEPNRDGFFRTNGPSWS